MAEIIRIILPEEGSANTPVAQSSADSGATSSGGGSGDGALTAKQAIGAAKKVMAYTGIKQIADSYISYEISQVNLRTGASEFQQRLQFAYSEGSQLASSIGAIAMGGIMGGVPGAALAAAGVGLTYLMKFIGWGQNANTLRTQQNLEDISIGMANIRAGVSGRRGANQ